MDDQITWLKGKPKKAKNEERICPKRHIRQDQWQSEWNEMFLNDSSKHCYDFISDFECIFDPLVVSTSHKNLYGGLWNNLQAAKENGTSVSIVNIAHFTQLRIVEEIVASGGFRGGEKKINEDEEKNDVTAMFSWWSPIFYENDIKLVRDTLRQPFLAKPGDQFHGDGTDQDDEIHGDQDTVKGRDQQNEEGSDQNDQIAKEGSEQKDDKDDSDDDDDDDDDDGQDDYQDYFNVLQEQFASSNPFNPKTILYGNYYFQYGLNELCRHYRNRFGGDQELQFKILGTFSYKVEVMHAVLICSQEYGNGLFNEYPPVLTPEEDVNNEAVVTRDNNGIWVWKPQATGTVITRLPGGRSHPQYRRWEHVAFAFHIPNEWENEPLMSVPDLRRNLHYLLS